MGVRAGSVILAFAIFLSGSRVALVRAQELTPGEVAVVVTDARTHAPVADADVFLLGAATPISSLTTANGRLTFPGVAPGTYSISVERDGYERYDSARFDVDPHSRVTLAIAMLPVLKTIASVHARASSSITVEDLNARSAQRKISQTLGSALNKLAGVSVDDYNYSPASAFDVSLRNHDASQTGYSLDGIRIVGPSSGLLGGAQSLFTGASVSFAPTAGSLGGTIDFQTLQPTKLWTAGVQGSAGNYGAQTSSFSFTARRAGLVWQRSASLLRPTRS